MHDHNHIESDPYLWLKLLGGPSQLGRAVGETTKTVPVIQFIQ